MHEQDLAILKGLVSVAWADGHVHDTEHEVIDALLEAFHATPSEAHEVRRYAATQRAIDDVPVADLSFDDRRVLLQHAVLLTLIDGDQAEAERKILDDLCRKLRIPEVEAKGIISTAERRAKEMRSVL
jgi:prepilin-type processing-associated H-X9-DG protein